MQNDLLSIHSDDAPAAIGPYSQAIAFGDLVFTSGQIPLDPKTGALVEGDIEVQARRVFANLSAVLTAAGTSLERAIKVGVYLKDLGDFQRFNALYREAFGNARPARTTLQVAKLPLDARVEVDVIAAR